MCLVHTFKILILLLSSTRLRSLSTVGPPIKAAPSRRTAPSIESKVPSRASLHGLRLAPSWGIPSADKTRPGLSDTASGRRWVPVSSTPEQSRKAKDCTAVDAGIPPSAVEVKSLGSGDAGNTSSLPGGTGSPASTAPAAAQYSADGDKGPKLLGTGDEEEGVAAAGAGTELAGTLSQHQSSRRTHFLIRILAPVVRRTTRPKTKHQSSQLRR